MPSLFGRALSPDDGWTLFGGFEGDAFKGGLGGGSVSWTAGGKLGPRKAPKSAIYKPESMENAPSLPTPPSCIAA